MGNDHNQETGARVAEVFLQSLKENDAVAFWEVLDGTGRGFFYGMWFYAMGNMSIAAIKLLAQEHSFLKNALEPILENVRANLQYYLGDSKIGEIKYVDALHARVPVFAGISSAHDQVQEENIPLVLELSPAGGVVDAGQGLTRWRVDILSCLQIKLE